MKTFARFQRARAAVGALGARGSPIGVQSFAWVSRETSHSRIRRQNCSYSRARRTRIERGFVARGTHPCSHPGTDALASKPSFDCWRFSASSNRAMDAKSLLSRTTESRAGEAAALLVALRASNFFNDAISADSSAFMRARLDATYLFSSISRVTARHGMRDYDEDVIGFY